MDLIPEAEFHWEFSHTPEGPKRKDRKIFSKSAQHFNNRARSSEKNNIRNYSGNNIFNTVSTYTGSKILNNL